MQVDFRRSHVQSSLFVILACRTVQITNLETHDFGLVDPLIVGEAGRHFGWVKSRQRRDGCAARIGNRRAVKDKFAQPIKGFHDPVAYQNAYRPTQPTDDRRNPACSGTQPNA